MSEGLVVLSAATGGRTGVPAAALLTALVTFSLTGPTRRD
jgi:hypothetical protein